MSTVYSEELSVDVAKVKARLSDGLMNGRGQFVMRIGLLEAVTREDAQPSAECSAIASGSRGSFA